MGLSCTEVLILFHLYTLQELSVSQQEQLQQRAAYLRQQRDKLHALKKEQQKPKQVTVPEEAPTTTPTTPVSTALFLSYLGHLSQRGQRSGSTMHMYCRRTWLDE